MTILVSACLLGCACRYDGSSNPNERVRALAERHTLIPVCPEQLGGLPTPRSPAEWQGDRIHNAAGEDVTAAYEKGAALTVQIAREHHAECAILKERSPACGCYEIYDGSFRKRRIPGMGSAAAALKAAGFPVYGETKLPDTLCP